MIRVAMAMMIGLVGVTAAGAPALAQFNPFLAKQSGPALRGDDLDLFLASVNHLNRAANAAPGLSETWSNPRTGSKGTSRITEMTTKANMACHVIQHAMTIGKAPRSRDSAFTLTWCLTPDRGWKVAD